MKLPFTPKRLSCEGTDTVRCGVVQDTPYMEVVPWLE